MYYLHINVKLFLNTLYNTLNRNGAILHRAVRLRCDVRRRAEFFGGRYH